MRRVSLKISKCDVSTKSSGCSFGAAAWIFGNTQIASWFGFTKQHSVPPLLLYRQVEDTFCLHEMNPNFPRFFSLRSVIPLNLLIQLAVTRLKPSFHDHYTLSNALHFTQYMHADIQLLIMSFQRVPCVTSKLAKMYSFQTPRSEL